MSDHHGYITGSVRRCTAVVHIEEVATLERCRTCPHSTTCVRHAPNVCLRNDYRARSRVIRDNALRSSYLTEDEIKLLSILELGFACTCTGSRTCRLKTMENSL